MAASNSCANEEKRDRDPPQIRTELWHTQQVMIYSCWERYLQFARVEARLLRRGVAGPARSSIVLRLHAAVITIHEWFRENRRGKRVKLR